MKKIAVLMFLAAMLIFALTGCGSGGGGGSSDQDQINSMLDQAQAAVKSHDFDKLISLATVPFDADGMIINDLATLRITFETQMGGQIYEIFEYNNRTITVYGNTATVDCILHQKGTEAGGGGAFDESVHQIVKCAKENGWKFAGFTVLD